MRETPSGGVGSIQDQGVNYIQLNIQPSIPLLNTELRNATLNKDYERWTPLDGAQVAARAGQPWPRRGRVGGRGEGLSSGRQPALGWGAGPRCTSLSAEATAHGRAGPAGPPPRRLDPGRSGRQLRPWFLGLRWQGAGSARVPLLCCAPHAGLLGSRLPGPGRRRPAALGPEEGQPVGAGAVPGRLALTSPRLGLKGLEGRHPRGGFGGGPAVGPLEELGHPGPRLLHATTLPPAPLCSGRRPPLVELRAPGAARLCRASV